MTTTADRIAVMQAIDAYCDFATTHPDTPDGYSYEPDTPGKNVTRIVMVTPGQRMCHAFVDNLTGDLLKAAGWKAPAKGARGNLVHGMADVEARFHWTGRHLYKHA